MEGIVKAKAAAARALALDPELAQAHVAAASIAFHFDWEWDQAEAGLKRAIALDPADIWALHMYATLLRNQGRIRESIEQIQRAQRLDPVTTSVTMVSLGELYTMVGELENAAKAWQNSLELAPNEYRTHRALGTYQCRTGNTEEGLRNLEQAAALPHDEERLLSDLAYCHGRAGHREKAEALLRQLEESAERQYVDPVHFALANLALGNRDRAIEWLERAVEIRAQLLTEVGADARYAPLHSDARYQQLLREIGLERLLPPPRG